MKILRGARKPTILAVCPLIRCPSGYETTEASGQLERGGSMRKDFRNSPMRESTALPPGWKEKAVEVVVFLFRRMCRLWCQDVQDLMINHNQNRCATTGSIRTWKMLSR